MQFVISLWGYIDLSMMKPTLDYTQLISFGLA